MKTRVWLLVMLAMAFVSCGDTEAPRPVRLLEDGQSEHRIVLQADASPSERHAAEELQAHFEACTGARLPIVEGEPADDAPMIVLGRGPVARRLGVDPSDDELGDQGAVVQTVPPHLVIAGTPQAGTLYGVHRSVIEQLRRGQPFYEGDAPSGGRTFTGTKGLRLTQRFDDDQVEFAWLYAYPETLGQLEVELWAPRATLQPGESIRLRQEIEIQPAEVSR